MRRVAGYSPTSKKHERQGAGPAQAPAPSRIRNRRQSLIVETVAGYESVLSTGSALSVVHIVWVLVGVVVASLGASMLVLGAGSDAADSLVRALRSLGYGIALLTFATAVVAIIWAVQAAANVSRLGRSSGFGQATILARHFALLVVGAVMLAIAPRVSELEAAIRLAGGAAVLFGLLMSAALGHSLLKMLWRTSALGEASGDAQNREIGIWFVSICVFTYASSATEYLDEVTVEATGMLALAAGLGAIGAAVTALRIVPAIALRQEERLRAILASFGETDDSAAQPVTAQQIQDAWSSSSDLFSVDGD